MAAAEASAVSARRTVLVVLVIAVLAAIGLALLVTRSVTRPLAALGTRLRSLDDHCLQGLGDGPHELARTAEQLERLVRRLQGHRIAHRVHP